ncbi:MAG: FAD-dependent oxidoreductase [Cytophagales bacterium]|nr:FAD-dependent oxidoreductase [Cytophagales bacterium]
MAKFLIAGAGIAGLSAALALAKSGHEVTVLEQAPELSEVGAGIQLGPNVMRILIDWGLGEPILDKGYEPADLVVRDVRDDRVLTARTLDDARKKYGAPHICIRRCDLQSVLFSAAVKAGAVIKTDQPLNDLPNMANQPFDALLGCDGLHSKVREHMLSGTRHGKAPRSSGHTAYRAMLNMNLLPMHLRSRSVQVWLGSAQHAVAYPVNQQQMNIVIVQEGAPTLGGRMSAQLHALIVAVQANSGFTTWPLFHRPLLLHPKLYTKGNIALLGDAAHPMLPYLAQGAAMAIEDAECLAQACVNLKDGSQANIHKALRAYAKARWRRNARVQAQSSWQGWVYHASGLVRYVRNAALWVAGKQLTAMPWLYDYQHTKK